MKDIVIIGAGTAGLTAAIYGARAGLSIEVLESNVYGGQIINTVSIDNYPGMPKVSGADYAQILYRQAEELGAVFTFDDIVSAHLTGKQKEIVTQSGTIKSKTVIIATGSKPLKLNVPGEERLSTAGISYCTTCDGAFYRGQDVAVIGGGNTAAEDALTLSKICKTVYLVHRRKEFRAEYYILQILREQKNVVWVTDSVVSQIAGEETVEGIEVIHVQNSRRQWIDVSGVFVSIGSVPDNKIFSGDLRLDSNGYVVADESCVTNLPGVFAAGDTRTKKIRQLVTAAADGAVAALAAGEYIAKNMQSKGETA